MSRTKKQYNNKDIKYQCDYTKNIFHNIKEYLAYRSRRRYLLKNGYSPNAVWNTDLWFIDTTLGILQEHFNWNKEWLDQLDPQNIDLQQNIEKMISLLKIMQTYTISRSYSEYEAAKEEFFKLFSENFNKLWN